VPCVAFLEWLPVYHLRFAVIFLALLVWAAPARAVTVAFVRPLNPSPVMTETLVRLHGELLSVGLEPEIVDAPAALGLGTVDAHAWREKLAAERGVEAVIAITGDATPVAAEVWIIDKAPRGFEVSRVPFEPKAERPSERLAIRTIEVLRSRFLEIDLAVRERRGESILKPQGTPVSLGEANRPVGLAKRFGVELGAAVVTSQDGVKPAILPMVRFDWPVRSWLVIQAALAGLGTRPTIANALGNAQVSQDYGIVGGCYRFRSGEPLRPFFALAAGILHTSVEGRAKSSPNQGHTVDQWSFLFDGSVGAALHLPDPFYVTLAAHVQMAEPYPAVHFVDTVVATSARPNLLLTLTIGAWL
jgi:hypothetical protein